MRIPNYTGNRDADERATMSLLVPFGGAGRRSSRVKLSRETCFRAKKASGVE